MSGLFHLSYSHLTLPRIGVASTSRHVFHRSLTSSAARAAGPERSTGKPASVDENGNRISRFPEDPPYKRWLSSTGAQFRDTKSDGTNWLGGEVVEFPFPLNPSFKPPPPLSNTVKTQIFDRWKSDPRTNHPRQLSVEFNISINRVEAIIRLKLHEAEWIKDGKQLHTAYQKALEGATGVPAAQRMPRTNAAAADYDADWEQLPPTDTTPIYWEPVDEGKEPVVPALMDTIAQKKLQKERRKHKPVSVSAFGGAGRTTIVDVGKHFEHTNAKKVKRSDPRHKGPHWVPEFTRAPL